MLKNIAFLLAILPATVLAQNCENNNPPDTNFRSCIPLDVTSCDKFYTHSTFPNNITETFNEAIDEFTKYKILYTTLNCSAYAHVFVCLSLVPHCDPANPAQPMGPCASLCEKIISDCRVELTGVIFTAELDTNCLVSSCSRFPSENCIDLNHPIIRQSVGIPSTSRPPNSQNGTSATISCPSPNATYFSDSSRSFATGWIIFWSLICFISTSLTLCTFLLDTTRFQYPWRPVIYLALAFNVHSLAYLFSAALGRDIMTCPKDEFVHSRVSWSWAHTPCILVFILLYYSMMSGFLWWVVLTIAWFLVSALQWSHEAVRKLSPFFMAMSWLLPLLLTVILLASRAIGADELTATCFVVNDGSTTSFLALLLGVILPLFVMLISGMVFLVLGFIGMIRIRSFMQEGGKRKEKQILEKLMIRIGIFVAVYIIPASVLIGCFVYELASRSKWHPLSDMCSDCPRPNSAVFMVRIFMFLLIGALIGVWIWSRKTVKSWKEMPHKCGCYVSSSHADNEIESKPSAENVLSYQMPSMTSYQDSGMDST